MSSDQSSHEVAVAHPEAKILSEKSAVVSFHATAEGPIDAAAERRLLWKCDVHIIPVLFVLYMLSFLNRINIGNANIECLPKELRLTGS
jgi:hypothetical protein